MLRFNEYTTNTLSEMFAKIKADSISVGLTLKDETASYLMFTDGTIHILFNNVGSYMYFSVSFENTITGNYLTNYVTYYNSSNNFYSGGVYNMYLAVCNNGTDYGIGMFKTNSTLNFVPINVYRLKTTDKTLYAAATSGNHANFVYLETDGTNYGSPAHQIETLKITEQDYLYKRNLNVTTVGGFITDNEFFLNLYDACFPTVVTNTRCTWELNDGKYFSFSSATTANQYLFKYE